MLMDRFSSVIDDLDCKGQEYIEKDELLKGYALSALSGLLDGALDGCILMGVGTFVIGIGSAIFKKEK